MDKYGYENMLSAIVHVDETTPHLHLNFVPINDGRLSSKSLFDRQKLAELQTELWEQVGKKYGLQRGKENSQAIIFKITALAFVVFSKIIANAKIQAENSNIIIEQNKLRRSSFHIVLYSTR